MPKRITNNQKTDFIVNMKEKTFQKMTFLFLVLASAAFLLGNVPYYLAKGLVGENETIIDYGIKTGEAFEKLKILPVILMAFGFIGFLVLLISVTKKYFKLRENLPVTLLGGYLLICAVSTVFAYDRNIALFGKDGRYEGLIALIACAGLFAAASQLRNRKFRKLAADAVVVIAVINSVLGICQAVKPLSRFVPGFFSEALVTDILSSDYLIANGFVGSPFALGALCVMALGISVTGIMYEGNIKKRIFYIVSSALCFVAGLMTKNLAVVIGITAVVLTAAIIEIIRLGSGHVLWKNGFFRNPLGKLIASGAVGMIIFVVFYKTGFFGFFETYIVSTDSLRLFASNPRYDADGFGFYPLVWKDAAKIFKDNWLFGTGPDCIGMAKYGSADILPYAGSTDRAYNEYLNIAASTGAVSLVFWLGFLAASFKNGAKRISGFFNLEDSYTRAGIFTACIAYAVQAIFSISAITVTPFFFILLGLCVGSAKNAE